MANELKRLEAAEQKARQHLLAVRKSVATSKQIAQANKRWQEALARLTAFKQLPNNGAY